MDMASASFDVGTCGIRRVEIRRSGKIDSQRQQHRRYRFLEFGVADASWLELGSMAGACTAIADGGACLIIFFDN